MATPDIPERVTVDGLPVEPGLLSRTYIADIDGGLHLIEAGRVVEGGVRPLRGGLWRDAIGRQFRLNTSMAMLTDDHGDDTVGIGVEPVEPDVPGRNPVEVTYVEGT